MTSGVQTGNGKAAITALSVNQEPVQQSYAEITAQPIGTSSKTIYSYDLALDNDYANYTGLTAKSVYFVNGASTTAADVANNATTGLYLNAACTTSANTYIDYKFTNNQTLVINGYLKQPRANVAGATANNKLTVYVGIRDSYGGSSTTYARGVYSFTISFSNITATGQSGTKTSGSYTFRYGASTTQNSALAASGSIYSPKTVGTWSLCIQQPIIKNTSVTINAADLMAITAPAATNKNYFKAILVPTGAVAGLFSYSGTTTTFNGSVTGYTSLSITATGASANWQNVTFTLYMVENTTAGNVANTEPVGITYANRTFDVNFRVDNTRPTLRSSKNNVVDVAVGASVDVKLNDYFYDIDGDITTSTHQILGVEVPQNEFVQLDKYGNVTSTYGASGAGTGSYYNVSGGSLTNSLTTGKSTLATTFNLSIAASSVTSEAFVSYNIKANDTLTLTGLRPSYSQYSNTRSSASAYTGGSTSSATTSGAVSNPGHFYLLLHIRDNNDIDDVGIYLPIAIRVGYSAGLNPVNTGSATGSSVANQGRVSNIPSAIGNVGDSFYFVPMGVNIGNVEYPVGKIVDNGTVISTKGTNKNQIQALALDGDNFSTTTGLSGWSNKLNEFLTITSVPSGVSANNRAVDYADISTVDVYIPQSYFGGRVRVGDSNSRDTTTGVNTINLTSGTIAGDATAYYVTTGIKITLKSATMNRYFYVNVPVRDSAQNPVSNGVNIAINVSNTAPDVIDEDDIAKYKNLKYNYNGTITLSYEVPMRSTFFITPYDLVSDINMLDGGAEYPAGGFTLNGLSGKYASGVFTVGAAAGDKETSVNPLYSAATYGSGSPNYMSQLTAMLDNLKNQKQTVDRVATGYAVGTVPAQNTNILNDRLFFTRTSDTTSDAFTFNPTTTDFIYSVTNVADYVNISAGNAVSINGTQYNVDYLMFSAVTRTAADAEINLTVRDRYGLATIPITIKISIVNTPPEIKELDSVPELAVTANDGDSIYETSLIVTPDAVMTDLDGDKLVYVQSRGLLVARGTKIAELDDVDTLVDFGTEDNHPEYANLLCDKDGNDGNSLTTYYLKAVMDSTGEFTVTALGSTKNIKEGVYVYFFVTDNRGGTTLGYLPIEVVNTAPVFNASDADGFSGEDRLWSLESARDADIYRSRYIVGSENARKMLKEKEKATDEKILLSATDADIKLIATDADALQGLSGVVLSQRGATPTNYVNYSSSYDVAVPSINNNKTFEEQNAAVVISRVNDNGTTAVVPNTVNVQLLFYVNGEWYSRSDLINAIGTTIDHNDVFDKDSNRWKVRDWALRVTADEAFTGYKLRITFSVRDVAEYGGDTAGVPTAYKSDRRTNENENVLGYLDVPDVFMYISGTGIRTKDDYNVYGNNYVVEYEPKAGAATNYLVMKDEDTVSAEPYTIANAESAVGKFEYLSTITVPASTDGSNSYETVYVPMSYFGQQKAIVAPDASNGGVVKYKDTFVGYDMRSGSVDNKINETYDISDISNIASAISLYDGTTTWTGASGTRALRENPYLEIESVDYTSDMSGASYFSGQAAGAYAGSSDYYNTQLAVSTADSTYAADSEFIPDTNNRLIYLKDQAKKLLEHNFGLSFKKKAVRTGSTNLILTVNLALSEVTRDGAGAITAINTACVNASDARSISVSIRIENTPVDLVTDGTLKYDDTYYVDVSMSTSSSDAFALLRKDTDTIADYNKIYYTDNDYSNANYRDTAYFSLDSINGLSQSLNERPSTNADGVFTNTSQASVCGVNRAQQSMNSYYGLSNLADVNTEGAYSANVGKDNYTSYFNVTTSENGKIINIKASRKTYINESALNQIVESEFASDALFAGFGWNDGYVYGGLSYKQLTAIYASRGLRVVFGDVNRVDNDSTNIIPDDQSLRVYYPLKVLVYDTCGAAWNDASYVALEFRVQILNTTPTVNKDNLTYNNTLNRWEKRTKLAVNSTMYLELEKYVSDPDIFTVNSQLATVTQFNTRASGVDRETGDYLESPFLYNFTNEGMTQAALLGKKAGLSIQGSTDTDVIMYMEVEKRVDDQGNQIVEPVSSSSIPSNNRLWFKVNRRTSDDNGNILNEFEFTLKFRDNHHSNATPSETESITFIIEVENQAPVIETKVTRVTMHTGDYFVLLPAYYETFIGGKEYYTGKTDIEDFESDNLGPYALPKEGSPAYLKSKTYTEYYRSRVTEGAEWNFYEIIGTKYGNDAEGDNAFKTDTSSGMGGENLGFLGVANDDAPWRMRFEPKTYSEYNFVSVVPQNRAYAETNDNVLTRMPTALLITASRACSQRPVTFTIVDGEGGSVMFTIEFTIISAPPRALNPNIPGELSRLNTAHLEGILNTNAGQGAAQYLNNGRFNTYIIPSGGANGVNVDLGTIGKKTAYKETAIRLNIVATDPDDGEATLSLHGGGYFRVNGQDLVEDENGHYVVPNVTNYFYITKSDNTLFTIHATGYNPSSAYETLTFRVADPGNDVYANSIEITINVYTIYSDMENPTVGKLQPGAYSDSKQGYLAGSNVVHVKPYDEYLGIGAYANNKEYEESAGHPTVYNYIYFAGGDTNGNTDGTAESPIVDRDVSAAGTMTYAAYVYAFMEGGTALTSDKIGELLVRKGNAFSIDPEKKVEVNNKYLIGGINLQGSVISSGAISASALGDVSSYFNFTVAADGASISFIPKTATLGKKLMLYIEVQKRIGNREATRTDDAVCAGTLFSLVVDDSAPRNIKAENQTYSRAFVGYKGSSVTFRSHGGMRGGARCGVSEGG
ncbi:MAG: hypothetical protein K2M48_06405, partial [Clostridiales bacterium]|nr:hypothetical protein [Clostridiales bacterium]